LKTPTRILLVDDHALLRESLVKTLEAQPEMFVVGSVGDADAAIKEVLRLEPDIILMDIDMPGIICFDAVKRIHLLRKQTRVIFLSAFHHDHYIEQALKVKARGYLTKSEPLENVIKAIQQVAAGRTYFSDEVMDRIVADTHGLRLEKPQCTRTASLTNREVEVLRYLARGLSKKEIAYAMHLSVKSVDGHATRLMSKLTIHDRVELTRFAIREGLAEA
jgi:DNA-binding NarL/FixJ family response regulator